MNALREDHRGASTEAVEILLLPSLNQSELLPGGTIETTQLTM